MKYLTSIILIIFSVMQVIAQDLSVSSFKKLETDLDARVNHPVKEQNGKTCALIKVVNSNTGFSFDTGTLQIIKTQQGNGEIWVYVQPRVRKMTINHHQLGIIRDYIFPEEILEATTDELVLDTKSSNTNINSSNIETGFLIIKSDPTGAEVWIDEMFEGNTPFSNFLKQVENDFFNLKESKARSQSQLAGIVDMKSKELKKYIVDYKKHNVKILTEDELNKLESISRKIDKFQWDKSFELDLSIRKWTYNYAGKKRI